MVQKCQLKPLNHVVEVFKLQKINLLLQKHRKRAFSEVSEKWQVLMNESSCILLNNE